MGALPVAGVPELESTVQCENKLGKITLIADFVSECKLIGGFVMGFSGKIILNFIENGHER